MRPPIGTRNFILMYHGCAGISRDSLLILPGFFMVDFLKPMKEPSQTLGIENMQKTKKIASTRWIGMVAEEDSNHLAVFTIKKTTQPTEGNAKEVKIVHKSQSEP
mgnify:CR=1 FL=1